ncbi:MAG TPA: ABC transporter permease [Candidatus Limnocylindria bacterium]|nr:ABC transporter permease [Candidatus Limnocylindria bacterium]
MTTAWLALAPTVARMALGSLRANRLRSLLTTLGVVIGVATVVAMASIIQGFNRTVEQSISSFGSHTIYVRKLKPDLFVGGFPDSLRHRPAFTEDDAVAIRRLCPDVREVSILGFIEASTLRYRNRTAGGVQVIGADPAIQVVNVYDPWLGRFFTGEEVRRRSQVLVIGKDIRETLFSGGNPIGKIVHVNQVPFRVVGELEPKGKTLFFNPDEIVTIPYTTLAKYFPPPDDAPFYVPKRGEYYLNAVAVSPQRTAAAVDQIREVLRRRRGLSPRASDNFAVFTEDALAQLYDQLTGATYAVMILISSIALLVGGIGVMNIMLVAVTERTKEIGLRKAVGAPRMTILFQFLCEAATLTGLGGLTGIGLGAGVGQIVRVTSGLPAYTPWWSVIVAFVFSVAVGLFFGLYPAVRASRLDPVEALRWE